MVNHFSKAGAITTKVGLMSSLLTLKWYEEEADCDKFFPRCYDLSESDGLWDFVEDFKLCAALSLVRRYLVEKEELKSNTGEDLGQKVELVVRTLCDLLYMF